MREWLPVDPARSGAYWQHLPERDGQWQTVYRRFHCWCHAGMVKGFETPVADPDNQPLMFDSDILHAHQVSGAQACIM
ncbi:transposase [Komagataeibacter xylinus]|uniref:transposase n=1 Tax=Komagataeibacter xylinus TaxID=28448 RepID=UPI001031DD00|nr:transposase [Komagataeibacter xylinus]